MTPVLVALVAEWIPIPVFSCLAQADAVVMVQVTGVFEKPGNPPTQWARFLVSDSLKGSLSPGDTFSFQFAALNQEKIWTSVFYPEAIYFEKGQQRLLLLTATQAGYSLYMYYPYAVLYPENFYPGFTQELAALMEFDTLGPDTSLLLGFLNSDSRIIQESGLYLARFCPDSAVASAVMNFTTSEDGVLRRLATEALVRTGFMSPPEEDEE